ncbi:MAG TPA: ABC transporter ATP-binding protein [Trebonia sp.]|nr:ABC transporter ATP-binding protein [Trebonia sp.]
MSSLRAAEPVPSPRLVLEDVHTYYGQSHVLQGISLTVREGEVVALLGRNGAGKTTTMRSVTGLTRPRRGRVLLDGTDISRLPPHRIARAGVAYVPSGRRVFGSLTVRQNLELALRGARGAAGDGAGAEPWTLSRVHAMFPRLAELGGRRAGFLSGGEQQLLKLARALLARPRLLLLDEPTEGLAPVFVTQMRQWIEVIRGERMSILLSEQNSLFALHLADRGYILSKGRIEHEAPAAELAASEEVRVHLGVAGGAAP